MGSYLKIEYSFSKKRSRDPQCFGSLNTVDLRENTNLLADDSTTTATFASSNRDTTYLPQKYL